MQCFCFHDAEPMRSRKCKYPGESPIPKRLRVLEGDTVPLYLAQVSINTDSICCMRQALAAGFDIYNTIPDDEVCKYGFLIAAIHAQSFNIVKYFFDVLHYDISKLRIPEYMGVTPTELIYIYLFVNIMFKANEIKDLFYFLRNHGIICNSGNIMFPILKKLRILVNVFEVMKTVYTTEYLMDICPKLDDETDLHRAARIGDVDLVRKLLTKVE